MRRSRSAWLRLVCMSVVAGSTLGCDLFGDGTNDYDCEATWSRKGEVLSRDDYEYLALPSEFEATRRCKQEMLDNIPKGGKLAECKCIGRKSEHVTK